MSAWGQWADEALGVSDNRWAYLYGLSHRRAEMFLQLLVAARKENAELSEALEEAVAAREEAEAREWSR